MANEIETGINHVYLRLLTEIKFCGFFLLSQVERTVQSCCYRSGLGIGNLYAMSISVALSPYVLKVKDVFRLYFPSEFSISSLILMLQPCIRGIPLDMQSVHKDKEARRAWWIVAQTWCNPFPPAHSVAGILFISLRVIFNLLVRLALELAE